MEENDGKSPIRLAVGGVDIPDTELTRAVITDGTGKTMQPFDVNTKIFMVMKSEMSSPAAPSGYEDYGYKGAHAVAPYLSLYTVCRGEVTPSGTTTIVGQTVNTITFPSPNQHYWDDAHARSSQLSIWAYAQKGQPTWNTCYFQQITGSDPMTDPSYKREFNTAAQYFDWQNIEIYPAIREWSAMLGSSTEQTAQTVQCQDLLFSNNLTYNSAKSWPDNRLKFDFTEKHFPSGATTLMKFYHAMSKITIQIKAGEGFKADGTDFVLGNTKSVDLLAGFNTKGLFNIKDGEFQMIHESITITSIPLVSEATGKSAPNYILEALAVPNIHQFLKAHSGSDTGSRFVESGTNVMIQFTVDGNTYKITSDDLYNALKALTEGDGANQIHKYTDNGNYIPMEAGKNYVFTFTIGKQTISNISANLADWLNVTATEQTPSNAYVSVSVKTTEGDHVTGDPTFALYRAPGATYTGAATEAGYNAYADYTWEKGYEKSTNLAETGSNSGIYTTEWYWPDNNTFYHFRTISPSAETIEGNDATTYISVTGGVIKAGSVTAEDYIWGAPFKTSSPTPDNYSFETGFCNNATKADGQLYKAIGATKDNITLTQHHMTSQVFVDLETSTGTDAVDLTDATITLVNLAQNAKLYLGNGLVTGYSNFGNINMTADAHAAASPVPAYDYSYGVLPQQLANTNGAVGLKITTTDHNVYIINDLATIKTGGELITEWLPGRKYYYKFVLKKTTIEKIEATILDWEDVVAEEEEVKIQ